jgi:predicted ATPase
VLVLLEHQSLSTAHLQISQCRDLMQKFHHDWQWYFAHLSDIFGQPPTARELDKWEEDNKFEQDLHLQVNINLKIPN